MSVFVTIMQLEISAVFLQMVVFSVDMWVSIFIEIMQLGVTVAVMHRWYFFQCIMHVTISIVIMEVTVSIVAMHACFQVATLYFFL